MNLAPHMAIAQMIASIIAPPVNLVPVAPSAVALNWQGLADGGFNIYWGTFSHSYEHVQHADTNQCVLTGFELGLGYYFSVTAVDTNGAESDFANQFLVFMDGSCSRVMRFYLPPLNPIAERTTNFDQWTPAPECFPVAVKFGYEDWFISNPGITSFYRLTGSTNK